jgi:hypothetical protein
MAFDSTQALTELSTMNFLWGKERPAFKADNFTADYLENVIFSTSHIRITVF